MPNWVRNKLNVTGNQTEIKKLIETLQSENGLIDFDRVCPMPDGIRETAEWDSGYGNRIAYRGDSQKQAIIGEFLVMNQSTFLKEDVTLRHLFFTRFEGQKQRLKNESLIRRFLEEQDKGFSIEERAEARKKAVQYFINYRRYGFPDWYGWCVANWGTKWNAGDAIVVTDGNGQALFTFMTAWNAPLPIIQKIAKDFPTLSFDLLYADEDYGNGAGYVSFQKGELKNRVDFEHGSKAAWGAAMEVWELDEETVEELQGGEGA